MALDAEIATFYGDEFGVSATYTHGGTPATITVIFDRAGAIVSVGGMEVQTATPTARCKTSDVSSATRGDTLVISGTTYYVMRAEPLNNEETLLHLSLDN